MKKIKVIFVALTLLLCIASLTACSTAEQYFVYGTALDISVDGIGASKAINNVYEYISALENVLSPTIEGSDLQRINSAPVSEPVKCEAATMQLMKISELVWEMSNGAYDPSIYPLVRLWSFSGDKFVQGVQKQVPTSEQISAALESVGLKKAFSIDYEQGTITKLIDGAMLDFGGIAKGYATQKSLEMTDKNMLVNLGGNIGGIGKSYSIGIANPQRADRSFATPYFASFELLSGECVSTSGDYERYYQADGSIYHHIINPATGYPVDTSVEGGVISCTVVSTDGALADAIATAVVVLGAERGKSLCEQLNVKAFLITSDYSYLTVGDLDVTIKQ